MEGRGKKRRRRRRRRTKDKFERKSGVSSPLVSLIQDSRRVSLHLNKAVDGFHDQILVGSRDFVLETELLGDLASIDRKGIVGKKLLV